MSIRSWIGNKLFNIDKVVDEKVQNRLRRYNSVESDGLLLYRMRENQVWAKGNADRILEFYKTTNKPFMYDTDRLLFWKWVGGVKVPKLHYPAPEALLNSMKSLLFGNEPVVEFVAVDDKLKAQVGILNERLWAIQDENNINEIRQNGAVSESYSGTIAMKFIADPDVSKKPIIQIYPQERIELTMKYNRVVEIIFKDYYFRKDKQFTLKSIYGVGYIDYELYDDKAQRVPLNTFNELADLKRVEFTKKVLMAAYKKNRTDNIEFPESGYGGSDFEGIIDLFHQIDEIYSTMALYIRRTRPVMSLNEKLVPVSDDGRVRMIPNEYEYDLFITREADSAVSVKDNIHRDIPRLELSIYTDAIKELMKSIYQKVGYSAITANLDTIGANQSGVAMMELEKATMILYQNKTQLWEKFEQDYNRLLLMYEDYLATGDILTDYKEYELRTEFAEYHTDSFSEKAKLFTELYQKGGVDVEGMLKGIWEEILNEERIEQMGRNVKIEQGIPLVESDLDE